jgi:hypothetical protein
MSWLFEPMTGLVDDHLKTLAKYPPVQGGASFDMSNAVAEFLQRMRQ